MRNPDHETLRPQNERIETGAVWSRIARINVVLNEGQENAGNGKEKGSVRKEIIAVSVR